MPEQIPGAPGKYAPQPAAQGAKQLPNAAYGEQMDFQQIQGGAPMAKTNQAANVVRLDAPTQRPGEPVTAGSPSGPGPGPEILGLPTSVDSQLNDLSMIAEYLPVMQQFADSSESTGTMKAFVRYLRSQTG